MGCVRETPQMKIRPKRDKNSRDKKRSQHAMCKRNSPDKNEASTGCLRATPLIKSKPWDV